MDLRTENKGEDYRRAHPDTATVAQSCTLLYRGFVIRPASWQTTALPNAIRRYSRLYICATPEGLQ